MSLFSTIVAHKIILLRVSGSLGPLNALIPSSGSLEVVGALNHLILVQLPTGLAETAAEQDETQVQLRT
jgi:hypothetical protein